MDFGTVKSVAHSREFSLVESGVTVGLSVRVRHPYRAGSMALIN